jgi:hypothetical protein
MLRLQCDSASRRLILVLSGLRPPPLAGGQAPSVVVSLPYQRVALAGAISSAAPRSEHVVQAVVEDGPPLLAELSSEEGFAVGFGTMAAMSLAQVVPAQGLGGLIERYLGPSR